MAPKDRPVLSARSRPMKAFKSNPQEPIPYHDRTGDMPISMLVAKFDETDINDDPVSTLQSEWRSTLKDRTGDKNLFTHEETRRDRGSRQALNLRYNGHLGSDVDGPRHSEMMLDFIESDWRDPRGTVDPADMKEMRRQQTARLKFQRIDSDAEFRTTGGGVAPQQMVRDERQAHLLVAPRWKNFEESTDGRREGLRREYSHKSAANKTSHSVTSYGDIIKDSALNVQRKTEIVSNLTDSGALGVGSSRMYHQSVPDHVVTVASYGEVPGRSMLVPSAGGGLKPHIGTIEGAVRDNRVSETMTTMYTVMTQQARKADCGSEDAENSYDQSMLNVSDRKHLEATKDMNYLWYATLADFQSDGKLTSTHRKHKSGISSARLGENTAHDGDLTNESIILTMKQSLNKSEPVSGAVGSKVNSEWSPLSTSGEHFTQRSSRMKMYSQQTNQNNQVVDAIEIGHSVAVKQYKVGAIQDKLNRQYSETTIMRGTSRETIPNRRNRVGNRYMKAGNGSTADGGIKVTTDNNTIDRHSKHPTSKYVNRDLTSDISINEFA